MATRRRFTQEYQDQAVSLVVDSGRTIAEVSRSLGIHEMTLGKWVKQAKESGRPTGPNAVFLSTGSDSPVNTDSSHSKPHAEFSRTSAGRCHPGAGSPGRRRQGR
jgi:transposase